MKNLYETLEVDKNASDEIIKVAYKSLVKKYHPDLKEGKAKTDAEEKIKEINDAYDILSDSTKRAEYDQTLINENVSAEQYNSILKENTQLKMQLNYLQNNYKKTKIYGYNNYSKQENAYKNNNSNNYNEQNYSNNTNNANNNNNNINGFRKLDTGIKSIIAILLILLISFILFKIPFIREFVIDLFNQGLLIILIIIFAFFYFFRNKK